MEGRILGFIVVCMIGVAFLCWAVYAWFSKILGKRGDV